LSRGQGPRPFPLLAFVEQQLEANADPQERPAAAGRFDKGFDEPARAQSLVAILERADAGQHDCAGPGDGVGVIGNRGRVAGALAALLCAAQVAHAVVHNDDHVSSIPFVEGTSFTRESMRTASHKARENALKMASMAWCALVP